tara:strand:+ start:178 stop:1047 length:870 start_codon:yes stop_codon:yes gene_type:complete
MTQSPPEILLREVAPRDGLQNEKTTIPTEAKVRFIEMLWATGTPYLEVSSFVRPSWVPQLADAEEVFKAVAHLKEPGRKLVALVPNLRGYQRARDAGCENIALFTSASEAFNQKNTNASIEESIERFRPVCEHAQNENVWVRGYISTCFHCPYSGPVNPEAVTSLAAKLLDLGCSEIVVSDTTGTAFPGEVERVLPMVLKNIPSEILALHMHDTAGRALQNVKVGWDHGIRRFDSAVGGLGGCPYSPGATGNLRTELLVELFHGLEVETGIEMNAVEKAAEFIRGHIPA